MKLKEFINEEWEESKLRSYFEETKFLFVVLKKWTILRVKRVSNVEYALYRFRMHCKIWMEEYKIYCY